MPPERTAARTIVSMGDGPTFDITPADGADLTMPIRAIWVGSGGDIKVTTLHGTDQVFPGVPSGTTFPCFATKVFATGTTASGMVGIAIAGIRK